MELLSPTYQLIRNDAHEAGRAEGMIEGEAKGRAEGHATLVASFHTGIELGLKLRFGPPGLKLMEQVRAVTDPALLMQFLKAIESAPDLETLRNLLPPQA